LFGAVEHLLIILFLLIDPHFLHNLTNTFGLIVGFGGKLSPVIIGFLRKNTSRAKEEESAYS
jgi:hypothetical protein